MPRGTGLPSQAGSGAASSVQRGAKVPGKHVTLAAGQTRGRVPGFPGRRYRIPAELGEMNQENLLSVLVKIGSIGACGARGQDTWLSGPAAG